MKPEFWVVAENKDTGERFRVAVVNDLNEAKRIEKDHAERFPNDNVWFTRQILHRITKG